MRIFVAEIIGTASLVLMGCGAIIVNDIYPGTLGNIGIAMSFGIIVMAMIYTIGNISGAHLNPAVTIGFYLSKRIQANQLSKYISAQLIGAFIAAILLKVAFPDHETLGATIPTVNLLSTFIIEVLMTALLMFVILNVSSGHKEKGIMAGVAIGGTIMLEALIAGPLTGASMNPARSLAPAVLSLNLNEIWIYILAPIVGVIIAAPSCRFIQGDNCCVDCETEE